ncbi:MAG: ATP-binding cassette domain-containing protein [Candidatus Aureabacteria bacterium]|nr:ATP-binding cassette domain-containing protein [Candidatus Auribacterota bacterium]
MNENNKAIEVSNVSKDFSGVSAVKDISFAVTKSEVLGFLGPNGAGKTTTMRMIAGFLSQSSGKIFIDGININKNPLKTKEKIGYLPEHVPLYNEMRTAEYLKFRCKIKGIKRQFIKRRISEVSKICEIQSAKRKIIRNLSKGFRQRVGLADALLANPPILILDEPTTGLDPNQLRKTRNIIKSLRARHAVLLSTHMLSEVEAVCDRAIIINEGRIAANIPLDKKGKIILECENLNLNKDIIQNIKAINKITEIKEISKEIIEIYIKNNSDARREIFDAVIAGGGKILEMKHERDSLEDLFVEITSKQDPQ